MTFRPATLVDKWGVPFFQGEIDDGGGGGGSQTVTVVPAPIVFDDPDILTGIAVYTPAAGEVLLAGSFVSITTPWDGGFSLLSIFSTGDTPTAFDIAQGDPSNADGSWTTKTASPSIPFSAAFPSGSVVFTDATPVLAAVTDGDGGDPGSMQGEGEIVLLIVAA